MISYIYIKNTGVQKGLWSSEELPRGKTSLDMVWCLPQGGLGSCVYEIHQLRGAETKRLTESWNGRGWKGPLWVTQPNPLPKQGHPEQAAQHRVQAGLEYLQRRRLHNLPGQPGPGLHHPQREEVLPRVQVELPMLHANPGQCPSFLPLCVTLVLCRGSDTSSSAGTRSRALMETGVCLSREVTRWPGKGSCCFQPCKIILGLSC